MPEASKKYSAFRVTESGVMEHLRVERTVKMLDAASYVRRWLRQTERRSFQELLPGGEQISAEEFDRLTVGCMKEEPEIMGVYDVDLDAKEFSAVRPELGWITYRLKDVSTASWHSYRTGSYDRERRDARFMQKLREKEIPSAGHLGAEHFSFSAEMVEDGGRLSFYLDNTFDVDKVFGTRTARSDDALNVYAGYDMAGGQAGDELELVLVRADGKEEARTYSLGAVEKAALLRKMDDCCQRQTGQSLADYSAQFMTEGMAQPAGPVM